MTELEGRRRRRLCFVGPHLGHHAGWVTTQSEVIAELFATSGHDVRATSSVRSHIFRPLAMVTDLWRWRGHYEAVILSVYSGRAFYYSDLASRIAKLLGVNQVHVLHGGSLPDLAASRPRWVRRVLARADRIVAPSPFLARTAEALGLKAEVIPNVLDLEASPFRRRIRIEPPLKLLWVRTFHPIYRPLLAVEVLHRLLQRGIAAELTLAGQDKGMLAECRMRAEKLDLEDKIRFPGFLDAAGKKEEFANHDIYLHTNQVDNMPVTVLEAAAFGLPIVAAEVGGIPDLLRHEKTGLLIPDGDENTMAEAMSEAIMHLYDHPQEVESLSLQGRKLAEESAWPKVHGRWLELLGRLEHLGRPDA